MARELELLVNEENLSKEESTNKYNFFHNLIEEKIKSHYNVYAKDSVTGAVAKFNGKKGIGIYLVQVEAGGHLIIKKEIPMKTTGSMMSYETIFELSIIEPQKELDINYQVTIAYNKKDDVAKYLSKNILL